MDEKQVSENTKQHEAGAIAQQLAVHRIRSLRLECVHDITDGRDSEKHGGDLVQKRRGVTRQDHTVSGRFVAQQNELVSALGEAEIEGEKSAAKQEPYRWLDVN